MDKRQFANRVALVTGAAQGMGAATARRLAAAGARLALFDLQGPALARTSATLSGSLAFEGDVSRRADVEAAISGTLLEFGRLDFLVNAAGVLKPTPVFELSEDEWDWVLNVNLKGAFLVSRAAARPMKEQGFGRIVHFSSTAGKTASTLGGCHYTAAKHGVLGLTRALAKELAPFGITVNAVCPGLIDTEMVRETLPERDIEAIVEGFPVARLGSPAEVAELVCFLLANPYITGTGADINGGDLMV